MASSGRTDVSLVQGAAFLVHNFTPELYRDQPEHASPPDIRVLFVRPKANTVPTSKKHARDCTGFSADVTFIACTHAERVASTRGHRLTRPHRSSSGGINSTSNAIIRHLFLLLYIWRRGSLPTQDKPGTGESFESGNANARGNHGALSFSRRPETEYQGPRLALEGSDVDVVPDDDDSGEAFATQGTTGETVLPRFHRFEGILVLGFYRVRG